jgi:hypothetical protein
LFSANRRFPGRSRVANGIQRLPPLFGGDYFAFIGNGTRIASDVLEAVFLFPIVASRLLFDGSLLAFLASDAIMDASSFVRLRELISRAGIKIERSCLRSIVALCRHLGNFDLANLFIWSECDEMTDFVRVRLFTAGELADGIARNIRKSATEQLLLFDFGRLSKISEHDSLLTEAGARLLRAFDMTNNRIVTPGQAIAFHGDFWLLLQDSGQLFGCIWLIQHAIMGQRWRQNSRSIIFSDCRTHCIRQVEARVTFGSSIC